MAHVVCVVHNIPYKNKCLLLGCSLISVTSHSAIKVQQKVTRLHHSAEEQLINKENAPEAQESVTIEMHLREVVAKESEMCTNISNNAVMYSHIHTAKTHLHLCKLLLH